MYAMELFYLPNVQDETALLEDEELHHITRVMRKSVGYELSFTDGKGRLFRGVITQLDKRSGRVSITSSSERSERPIQITVLTALTKNVKRIEWAFEKLTELGVSNIVPLICKRSERDKIPMERVRKILIAAMKQSERLWIPELQAPVPMTKAVTADFGTSVKYVCYRSPDSVQLAAHYTKGHNVVCLIGPEGDFTDEELQMASDNGFIALSLGEKRLRTETASVTLVAGVHLINT